MGGVTRCCCAGCEPCAEQADLATWAIEETIFGMSFAGAFSPINETACTKPSCVCERRDNVEITGEAAIASDWTAYVPFLQCGTCVTDCESGDRPPPCPEDLGGNIECPPDYPKQVIWDSSARNGSRVKFFWSAGIEFCITAHYVGSSQIRFTVEAGFAIAAMAESSYGLQRRYRRREFFCGYTTPISTATYNDGGSLTVPEPLDPCVDFISEWVLSCDPYTPPTPPDPCESSTTVTVTESGCEIWDGDECVDVPDSVSVITNSEVNCCDGNDSGCVPTFDLQRGVVRWESEVYDCDSVPAEIELAIDPPSTTTEYTLEWECEPEWSNTTSPTVFTIPSTLTLTVA